MTQIFVKYILHLCIFRHLKLEIALAIPASNDEKWNSYTSISGSWHAPRPGSQRVNVSPAYAGPTLNRHWLNGLFAAVGNATAYHARIALDI